MRLLSNPARHFFFTGKGGVGKTSLACATAVALADRGRKVLIVSTDPASNLDAVLDTELANAPRPVHGVPGLLAMNIDPDQAAREYRSRTLAPYRSTASPAELALLEERLSGACTVEVAAFDEFTLLLTRGGQTDALEHVIFDTAPTGHTLRLLQLPAAWTGFLETGTAEESCIGPLSGLKAQRARYAETVRALADPGQTLLVLVARPDRVALLEAARTSKELAALGMKNQHLVVNGLFRASDPSDALARAYEQRTQQALSALPEEIAALPRDDVPLRAYNVVGIDRVRGFLSDRREATVAEAGAALPDLPGLSALAEELATTEHGLVLVMGKGGVGKTTLAAALAVGLASRGRNVHLTTTDPAQHLRETLPADVPGLRVSWIDPAREARRYREQALAAKGAGLSPEQRALLEEELRSPCYDELAVFQAFSRIVAGAHNELVILDTAPTGHTLLLLDTAGAYHRQMQQSFSGANVRVVTPLMHLQDPDYTRVIIVTLPETTPVLEAQALQEDLRRANIEPFAWVVNASLAAAKPRDALLVQRANAELDEIRKVRDTLAHRFAVVPFLAEEPVGAERLQQLARMG